MFYYIFGIVCLVYPNYTFVNDNVFSRNLVTTNLTASSILNTYNLVSSSRRSRLLNNEDRKQETLAFITPWNNDGYKLSLEFGTKFSIIVPVWFQVKKVSGEYTITGQDAINEEWLTAMKKRHPHIVVTPRLIFEISPQEFYRDSKQIIEAARLNLIPLVQQYKFGGIFIECPQYFTSPLILKFLPQLAQGIKRAFNSKQALVIADIPSGMKFNYDKKSHELIQSLFKTLDFAFISIYELPNDPSMAPIGAFYTLVDWLLNQVGKNSIAKVLLGLPMFGFDFAGESKNYVFGDDVAQILTKYKTRVQWIESIGEHAMFFTADKQSHTLYYPSLYLLNNRFELANQKGFAGVGFWELAQGMPYFFDLL